MIDIINESLLRDWKNWLVVWFVATIWLLAIHCVVQAHTPAQEPVEFSNGPQPNGNVTGNFETYTSNGNDISNYPGVPIGELG